MRAAHFHIVIEPRSLSVKSTSEATIYEMQVEFKNMHLSEM